MMQEAAKATLEERVQKLYSALKSIQEAKGYFFNPDERHVLSLLEQLLVTKDRYGYMACPCRFANGDYALDKDIICPCAYREQDVEEYETCYCGLYASKAVKEGASSPHDVPERRPPEKIIF